MIFKAESSVSTLKVQRLVSLRVMTCDGKAVSLKRSKMQGGNGVVVRKFQASILLWRESWIRAWEQIPILFKYSSQCNRPP